MRLRMNYEATCQWRTPEVDITNEDVKFITEEFGYEGETQEDFTRFICEYGLEDLGCAIEEKTGDEDNELAKKLYSLNGDEDWDMWDDSSWNGRDDEVQVHPDDTDDSLQIYVA
jgi:hypothetical protein